LFKNTTGKHLLQGPLTVLDRGSYAGDARIDNVPPGQDRLLSYGIDLELLVDNTKNAQHAAVLTAKIDKGELTISRKLVSSLEYAANNKTAKDKVLVIEHPIRYDWKLVDTQKPFETTPALYRFKGTALANKVTVLTVREETIQDETVMLASANLEELVLYSRSGPGSGEIPTKVRDAIGKAIQLRQSVVDVERDIATRNQRVAEITGEQNRIRENMKTVAQSTQYYDRLLAKLNEQESSIESLQKEREALIAKRDSLRRELEDYLNGLTVG
jgi:cell division protein FtsB